MRLQIILYWEKGLFLSSITRGSVQLLDADIFWIIPCSKFFIGTVNLFSSFALLIFSHLQLSVFSLIFLYKLNENE